MSQSLSTSAVKEVLQKPRYKTDMTKNKQKSGKNKEKKHTHTISHNFFYNHSTRGSFVARAKVTKSENPRLLSQLFRRTSRTGKL